MNRKEIKEAAKAKIKGNKWNIWWPYLVISIIMSVVSGIFGPKINIDLNDLENLQNIQMPASSYAVTAVTSIVQAILMGGFLKYIVDFVRTGKFNHDVIIKTIKEKWLALLVANLVGGLLIGLGCMLCLIPGIILAMAYAMVNYVILDTNLSGIDPLKKSREMMKGHKWEYFVFGLSFIGWFLLVPLTLGLIMIWLFPYMTVAQAMYYEKLKSLTK
jgi:uncharacterized membrane protein